MRGRFIRFHLGRVLFLLVGVGALSLCLSAQSNALNQTKDDVSAAYLYKLMNYTRIDKSVRVEEGAYVLGICASDQTFENIKNTLAGKIAGGMELRIVSLNEAESCEGCDVVFLEEECVSRLVGKAGDSKSAPLLVGVGLAFMDNGGDVAFVLNDDSGIGFIVNRRKAADKGFRFTAYLLKNALGVR